MTSKVYTGTTSIEEHLDSLVNLYGMPAKPTHRPTHEQPELNEPEPRKQSIEIQRLKREAGLA